MADFTQSKGGPGDVFPDGQVESDFSRVQPLITWEQVIRKHLFGIPLVSGIKDPITGVPMQLTKEDIIDQIDDACATVELESGLTVFPSTIDERQPFDVHLYNSFGYMTTQKRPVSSVEALTVTPSNEIDIFQVPLDWISTAYLHKGQINIVPLAQSLMNGSAISTNPSAPSTTANGAAFMAIFGRQARWIPAFWRLRYTAGFPNGKVPKVVNQLVGTIAAMEILSMLAATYARSSGQSLSIDGLSQSTSTPGPEIFTARLKDLAPKRATLTKKLKSWAGLTLFSSNV